METKFKPSYSWSSQSLTQGEHKKKMKIKQEKKKRPKSSDHASSSYALGDMDLPHLDYNIPFQPDARVLWKLMRFLSANSHCTVFLIPKNNIKRTPIELVDQTVFNVQNGSFVSPDASSPWCILTKYAQVMLHMSTDMLMVPRGHHKQHSKSKGPIHREYDIAFYRRLMTNNVQLLRLKQLFILSIQMDMDLTRCSSSVHEKIFRRSLLLHMLKNTVD